MTTHFHLMSAKAISEGIHQGQFCAVDVAEAFLSRIEKHDATVNAFTRVTAQRALSEAKAVDLKITAGEDPGPLAGVPYSVKNLFDLKGEVTLAGSKINADLPPAQSDATAVARLQQAGAICLGANNMGEYAYDFITANAHYGYTHNPHDTQRSAGGSSGGSAAAIAAGLSTLTLGTDTNGSIRVPASFCGIWGLKPTYGRLSRHGTFPFATSLDTIGVFGHCVSDLSSSFDVMSGADPKDPVCYAHAPASTQVDLESDKPLRCMRLGGYFDTKDLSDLEQVCQQVADGLACQDAIEIPVPDLARAAAFVMTSSEGAALHLKRLKHRPKDFDPVMRDRFFAGSLNPAAWYIKAQRFKRWWYQAMMKIFEQVDVIVAPATPISAPTFEEQTFLFRGERQLLRPNIGIFTQPITLIGLPVVAVPVHLPNSMPMAVQLIGKPYSELTLLQAAKRLENLGICRSEVAKPFQ